MSTFQLRSASDSKQLGACGMQLCAWDTSILPPTAGLSPQKDMSCWKQKVAEFSLTLFSLTKLPV